MTLRRPRRKFGGLRELSFSSRRMKRIAARAAVSQRGSARRRREMRSSEARALLSAFGTDLPANVPLSFSTAKGLLAFLLASRISALMVSF